MAEYQVNAVYYTSDNAVTRVNFDLDLLNSSISASPADIAETVANAIADALEGLVTADPSVTSYVGTNAKRFYAAVDNLTLT